MNVRSVNTNALVILPICGWPICGLCLLHKRVREKVRSLSFAWWEDKLTSCRISTFSLAYSSDINSLFQHCICSIGLCMHGSTNEGLKCNYCLSKKCDFFDKCFYYLINGESTHFKNCVIQGLKLAHQSFAEFVNYFSHSRLSLQLPHPQWSSNMQKGRVRETKQIK